MSACHTINPAADLHEETMRIKLAVRVIDERQDATLQQIYCCACDAALHTEWRPRPLWLARWATLSLNSTTGEREARFFDGSLIPHQPPIGGSL